MFLITHEVFQYVIWDEREVYLLSWLNIQVPPLARDTPFTLLIMYVTRRSRSRRASSRRGS